MLRHAENCNGENTGDENGTPPKKDRRGRKRKMRSRRDDDDDDTGTTKSQFTLLFLYMQCNNIM